MNEAEPGISEMGFQLAIKQTTTVRQTSEVIVKYWTILFTCNDKSLGEKVW